MMRKFIYCLIVLFLIGCSEAEINYTAQNEAEIAQYIVDNNLTATETSSGLHYIITKNVEGDTEPTTTSNVTVYYKGYFTNGTVFDESLADGIALNLNLLISGFSEGIRLLTVGDEATLIMPSSLAYGNETVGSIPAGSVLIFDVKLISIN